MFWIVYAHVLAVHFPIGLLVTATVFDAYGYWGKRPVPDTRGMFFVGVPAAWFASITGLWNGYWHLREGMLQESFVRYMTGWHLVLSLSATAVFSGVLWLKKNAPDKTMKLIHRLELFGLALLLTTAHLGGTLAHDLL